MPKNTSPTVTFREDPSKLPLPGVTPYPLGALRSVDTNDNKFQMVDHVPLLPLSQLPGSKYYTMPRGYVPLDQSRCHARNDPDHSDPLGCGHCVGYGGKNWLFLGPTRNPSHPYDADDLYFLAQDNDEWDGDDYNGTSPRGLMKAMQQLGYVSNYVWSNDVEIVFRWILAGMGPVIIGVDWKYDMFDPDRDGFIRPGGGSAGGHCLVIDGANQSASRVGQKIIGRKARLQNSWGTWGQNGRAWITYEDLGRLLAEEPNTAVSPVELRGPN